MKVAAVIPALNPGENLVGLAESLVLAGFSHIYVVDDGSTAAHQAVFEQLRGLPGCTVLVHTENHGKGRALKTAFEAFLGRPGECVGLVTLDADGQHSVEDAVKVAAALEEAPEALILGVRDFAGSQVPAKSAFGNKLTRAVFRGALGIPVTDTQTGLRGIPRMFIENLVLVQGERYEYETNMLLETKRYHLPIREVPIRTIYIDNNQASHFRPLSDGVRIYWLLARFGLASFLSAVVDYGLFNLLDFLLLFMPAHTRYFFATAGARACSALLNYTLNRRAVFTSRSKVSRSMPRYFILCVVQMMFSYGGVYLLSGVLAVPAAISKIVVDVILFFASFHIQKTWVFKE